VTAVRLITAVLGLTLAAGGVAFGVLVERIGAPWIWLLGFALATYGAWLVVQAIRMRGRAR
jgi:predicted MFS family arabinose efflux permease